MTAIREAIAGLAQSVLDGAINDTTTSIDLLSAQDFPAPSPVYRIQIENEVLLVTAKAANTLTVVRGQEGTSAASHGNATQVSTVATAGGFDQVLRENYGGLISDIPLGRVLEQGVDRSHSDFTWVNQGTATSEDVPGGGIVLRVPNDPSGFNIRAKVLTAPAAPWTLIGKVAHGPGSQPWPIANGVATRIGLCCRESATGEIITAGLHLQNFCAFQRWNSPTSFNANIGPTLAFHGDELWLKIEDNNTNLIMYISCDGSNWLTFWSQGRTAFMAGGPDQVGFFADSGNAVATTPAHFLSWVLQ